MEQEGGQYVTLHSLNAIRVCAEYCVVHYHVALGGHDFLQNKHLANSLMSFFFVLSGFMAMHTNINTDFSAPGAKMDYISRRLRKVYPTYLIWLILDTPGNIIQNWEFAAECKLFWVSIASQPILLHAWLGSFHIGASNGVCWYLCTLFWLWIMFPFINTKSLFASRPWTSIACLYAISVLSWIPVSSFNPEDSRELPIMRLCEFLMGCCVAFTLDKPIYGWWIIPPLLCFGAYCTATYIMEDLWSVGDIPPACELWSRYQQQPINLNPTLLLSMFSVVFCLSIHWLAATEKNGGRGISMLHWTCFKSLSRFSLHIYLSHSTVSNFIKHTSKRFGILDWWSTDMLLILCYLVAYLYSIAEPVLLGQLRFIGRSEFKKGEPPIGNINKSHGSSPLDSSSDEGAHDDA